MKLSEIFRDPNSFMQYNHHSCVGYPLITTMMPEIGDYTESTKTYDEPGPLYP